MREESFFLSRLIGIFALALISMQGANAQQQSVDVALAGFAYAGAANTIESRFPYSRQYEESQKAAGAPIGLGLLRALESAGSESLKIIPQIEELKGRDQAIAVALVIGSETVTHEQFGDRIHKLMVLIRGQAMFFDFKSMNVVRSYPLSFAYVDVMDHQPTPVEVAARVKLVYEGANGKPGLIGRFVHRVSQARLPAQVPRFLQVRAVQVGADALNALPAYLKSEPETAETWLADLASEAISTRTGVPIVPYAKGYAIGNVMSMRVSDGDVWQLNLPKPDYEIHVDLSGFKKLKFSEVQGGAASFVYGAYAGIRLEEPISRQMYLDTRLKNGETRIIPASQSYVDDFPHFYEALNGLFVKLAQAINGNGDEKWIKSAAAAKDIDAQISRTKELIKLCK